MKNLTDKQKLAIKCAYLDLVGSYQDMINGEGHAWDAHRQSIDDLLREFPFLKSEAVDIPD